MSQPRPSHAKHVRSPEKDVFSGPPKPHVGSHLVKTVRPPSQKETMRLPGLHAFGPDQRSKNECVCSSQPGHFLVRFPKCKPQTHCDTRNAFFKTSKRALPSTRGLRTQSRGLVGRGKDIERDPEKMSRISSVRGNPGLWNALNIQVPNLPGPEGFAVTERFLTYVVNMR